MLRIVVREGLRRDMADCLLADIAAALTHLRAHPPEPPAAPPSRSRHRHRQRHHRHRHRHRHHRRARGRARQASVRPRGGMHRRHRPGLDGEGREEDDGRMLKIGVLGAAKIAPGALIKPARRTGRAEVVAVAARDVDRAWRVRQEEQDPARCWTPTRRCWPIPRSTPSTSRCPTVSTATGPSPRWRRASTCCARSRSRPTRTRRARWPRPQPPSRPGRHGGLPLQYHPMTRRLVEIVQSGELGIIKQIDIAFAAPWPSRATSATGSTWPAGR